jgi:hypothetical protein
VGWAFREGPEALRETGARKGVEEPRASPEDPGHCAQVRAFASGVAIAESLVCVSEGSSPAFVEQ